MTKWGSEREYLLAEWTQALEHPGWGLDTLQAVGNRPIARVLDLGCGAAQELIPFVTTKGAAGFGVDRKLGTLMVASELLGTVDLQTRVRFACSRAEALPLAEKSFDVVICRGVLGYTDVRPTVSELARVLRPAGLAIVQMPTLRKGFVQLRGHLLARRFDPARTVLRELFVGVILHVSGRWLGRKWPVPEPLFSRRSLERELQRAGLIISGEILHTRPNSYRVVATRPAG